MHPTENAEFKKPVSCLVSSDPRYPSGTACELPALSDGHRINRGTPAPGIRSHPKIGSINTGTSCRNALGVSQPCVPAPSSATLGKINPGFTCGSGKLQPGTGVGDRLKEILLFECLRNTISPLRAALGVQRPLCLPWLLRGGLLSAAGTEIGGVQQGRLFSHPIRFVSCEEDVSAGKRVA